MEAPTIVRQYLGDPPAANIYALMDNEPSLFIWPLICLTVIIVATIVAGSAVLLQALELHKRNIST